MNLLPTDIAETLPAYGAQENLPLEEHVFYVKFFCIISDWTWYVCEYDPQVRVCFGYVKGQENEWGDFVMSELESLGIAIERDLYFSPCTFAELEKQYA